MLAALTIAGGLVIVWRWRAEIQFWVDRKTVARGLREMHGGSGAVEGEGFSTLAVVFETRTLPLIEAEEARQAFVVGEHRGEVGGVRLDPAAGAVEMPTFRLEGLSVTFMRSQCNALVDTTAGGTPVPLTSTGGAAIRQHLGSHSPPELLKDICRAVPADMDTARSVEGKYVALYRNAMKSVLLPDVAEHGALELVRSDLVAFVFGDIGQGRVVIDAYCPATQRFITILCERRDAGEIRMSDIERLLAGLRVSRAERVP